MPRAVSFDHYGDLDVLQVVEVERPTPGPGEVLVRVKAAGINPGEASIRKGLMHELWPATFPSGEGSDLAGVVEALGEGVEGFSAGDEVIGFTDRRASQAELVVVPAENLVHRPPNVSWEAAGALFVAGTTAYAAVRAVDLAPGETVVISGAAGGVGSIAVQLARLAHAPRDRPRERAQPRLAARPRGDPRRLRRGRRGAHPLPRPAARWTRSSTLLAAATSISRSSSA